MKKAWSFNRLTDKAAELMAPGFSNELKSLANKKDKVYEEIPNEVHKLLKYTAKRYLEAETSFDRKVILASVATAGFPHSLLAQYIPGLTKFR